MSERYAHTRGAVERTNCQIVLLADNLGIHTPKGSLLLRKLLDDLRGQLVLVYTPACL